MATFVQYEVLCVQFLSKQEVLPLSDASIDPLPGHVLTSYTVKNFTFVHICKDVHFLT